MVEEKKLSVVDNVVLLLATLPASVPPGSIPQ